MFELEGRCREKTEERRKKTEKGDGWERDGSEMVVNLYNFNDTVTSREIVMIFF